MVNAMGLNPIQPMAADGSTPSRSTKCQNDGTVYIAGLEPVPRKRLRVRISLLVPNWPLGGTVDAAASKAVSFK
jgi:hypothetical protein